MGGGQSKPMDETSNCDVELFLLGRTGHGKSATGNTILGRPKFLPSDMSESATLETDVGWTKRNGVTIKVVDGPGLLDTRLAGVKKLTQMQENLSKGFMHCPNGFHALVLVMRYGNRFTEEEQKTVDLLKGMLGDEFTRRHCILAFTDGESFSLNNKGEDFGKWCDRQTGKLRGVIDDCNGRVVLFHNLTPKKGDESVQKLISLAQALPGRYTADIFRQISDKRSEFIQKEGAIQLKELIQAKIDVIISYLEKNETGPELEKTLALLEEEIEKEDSTLPVVREIKEGINEARSGNYPEALKIFKNVAYTAQQRMAIFFKVIAEMMATFIQTIKHFII